MTKLLPWKKSLTYLSPFLNHTWNAWSIKDGGNNALEVMDSNESACFCLKCDLNWAHIFKELITNGLLGRYFLLSGSGAQSIENRDTDPQEACSISTQTGLFSWFKCAAQ